MPDDDGICLIALLAFLLIVRAFYTFCEHVLTEVNDSKIKELAEKNDKYKKVYSLISKPDKMKTAFSVHRIFSAAAIGASTLFWLFDNYKLSNIKAFWATLGIVALDTAVISLVTDILPNKISDVISKEKTAPAMMHFARALMFLFLPVRLIVDVMTMLICKLLKLSPDTKIDVVTEEEILMMVEAGNETGVIEESQREMINNIFEFGDVKVSEIMTHRTDIVGLEVNDKISDIIYLAINKGFSRMPVYEGSADKIIGIIYVKDFLCLVGCENPEDFHIKDFLREALYIPATNKCDEVFEVMTKKKMQMAVVIDEYGGTAGIVTMEDILEEIVGNIQDEYDEEEQELEKIADNTYIISGSADPEDILPDLGVKLPDTRDYDTMSAMLVELLGRIPGEDETPEVTYENVEFTVMQMDDNLISKIKAVINTNSITEEEQE